MQKIGIAPMPVPTSNVHSQFWILFYFSWRHGSYEEKEKKFNLLLLLHRIALLSSIHRFAVALCMWFVDCFHPAFGEQVNRRNEAKRKQEKLVRTGVSSRVTGNLQENPCTFSAILPFFGFIFEFIPSSALRMLAAGGYNPPHSLQFMLLPI